MSDFVDDVIGGFFCLRIIIVFVNYWDFALFRGDVRIIVTMGKLLTRASNKVYATCACA